jgi:uncharacterized protein YkwD/predicted phage tail protein
MSKRPLRWVRRLFAGGRDFSNKHTRVKSRRSVTPLLEALEDRLTPSAGVQEQYMLTLINRMRQHPAAELGLILNANDTYVNNALSFFNVDRTALANQWATLTPAAPLAWNDDLAASALAHSQAMLSAQVQSHQVPGEPDLPTRVTNAGYTNYSLVGENIFAYANEIFEAEAAFAIDWGNNPPTGIQSPAGHRANLMASGLREVGIGLVSAPAGSPMGPLLVTQDFGNRFTIGNPYLLGSVYTDLNHNGFYDPGEGVGGAVVTITGSAGSFQTTTSAAGGYQIQVPAGTYQVSVAGGGTQTVVVGTDNVQADFIEQLVAAPTITAPAASTTSTTPTFAWTAVAGATQYDLWVNNLTTGQSQVIRDQTLTTNSFTPLTPLPAGNYQAMVRASTAAGTSAWSAAYTFTITAPAVPAFTAPTGSTTNLTPTFAWTASTDAARYDLVVDNLTTSQWQIIRQQNLTTNAFTPASSLPTGAYEAWVRAFNNAGNTAGWSAILNFTMALPAAPTPTGPAAVITTTTPTFTWTASAGATQYDVVAANLTTGQGQVFRQIVTATSYTPASAIPRGQYTYWVRAGNSAGAFGPWSAGYSVLIDTTAPPIPTFTGPASTTSNVLPTFAWTGSAAARYDLCVCNQITGQTPIRQQNLTTNSFTPTTALPVGSYVAWVRAFDGTNQTRGWSASYYVTVTAPAMPVLLSPTGFSSNTMPTFTWTAVADAVRYDLSVNNLTTGQIQVIRQQTLATNSYTPLTGRPAGSYCFWVRAFNANGDAGLWSAPMDFAIG